MADLERSDLNGVATLRFNREEKLNAITTEMFQALDEHLLDISRDDAISAIVFTGTGRAFSVGRDIDQLGSLEPGRKLRYAFKHDHVILDQIRSIEKPTIAAINGLCVGGGLEWALCCDIRIAAEPARFGYPENKLGLIPASGGLSLMQKVIGLAWTKELVLTGEFIDVDRAREIGLITRVSTQDNLLADAQRLGESFGSMSQGALGVAKLAIEMCSDVAVPAGRDIERMAQTLLTPEDDHREGLAAFYEKRPPVFRRTQ